MRGLAWHSGPSATSRHLQTRPARRFGSAMRGNIGGRRESNARSPRHEPQHLKGGMVAPLWRYRADAPHFSGLYVVDPIRDLPTRRRGWGWYSPGWLKFNCPRFRPKNKAFIIMRLRRFKVAKYRGGVNSLDREKV
jgi:hypothetical protein